MSMKPKFLGVKYLLYTKDNKKACKIKKPVVQYNSAISCPFVVGLNLINLPAQSAASRI